MALLPTYHSYIARKFGRNRAWIVGIHMLKRGILASVFASTMFATIYFLVTLMSPLTAQDIFAWRMGLTGPLVTIFVLAMKDWPDVTAAFRDIRRRPGVILVYVLNAANLAAQQWVFIWAPLHNRALEASLGYFLMPLVMVVIGRVFYRESMSNWQIAATLLAALGVGHELFRVGSVSWILPFVAIGFPLIFVSRRSFKTGGQGGSWIELNLICVFAISLLIRADFHHTVLTPKLIGLFLLMAAISAGSLMAYYFASQAMPFSLFGLLSYLEPVLLVIVAYLLGESVSGTEFFTYIPIWIAVALLMIEGAQNVKLRPRRRKPKPGLPPG